MANPKGPTLINKRGREFLAEARAKYAKVDGNLVQWYLTLEDGGYELLCGIMIKDGAILHVFAGTTLMMVSTVIESYLAGRSYGIQ